MPRPKLRRITWLAVVGSTIILVKVGYVVSLKSQLILAARNGSGMGADTPFLEPNRRKVRRYVRQRNLVILADSGFDAKTVRPGDLIPPIRRGSKLKLAERIERMYLVSAARLDGFFG